jgi:hypothetical protein
MPYDLAYIEEHNRAHGCTEICPACHGDGGRGAQPHCSQCVGWGKVKPGLDATCVHEDDRGENIGRCLTLYRCTKCGRRREVDSSD